MGIFHVEIRETSKRRNNDHVKEKVTIFVDPRVVLVKRERRT